ncbi:helix-turn-helix domain-containing protein [Oribacterium parvum]
MNNQSMGDMISTLRKEKGMTQKDLADRLSITDKAVSKWERNLAFPDTATIPGLAEILGISVEELMNAKFIPEHGHKGASYLLNIILKALPTAMGIAVLVISILGELDRKSAFTMLGIGLTSMGIYQLRSKD